MSHASLLETLATLDSRSSDLVRSLEDRKREELEFHNEHHSAAACPNGRFYVLADAPGGALHYVRQWVSTATVGKVFLDYACGNGFYSVLAAKSGCDLSVGIDISDVSVQNARETAKSENLTNARFLQADCENTGLPADSFDRGICSGMLHHLDLARAMPELKRILKPGGSVLAVEALKYNPAIGLYRRLTPNYRTSWEVGHIIGFKQIRFIQKYLKVRNTRYFHIADLGCIPLIGRPGFSLMRSVTSAVDRVVTRIPGLQLMSWIIVFEMYKE